MLVHAHPDDESLGTGVTMARYAAEGAAVTLVTCTLGEEGEIVADDLAHLTALGADELGSYRLGELAAAMAALGVTGVLELPPAGTLTGIAKRNLAGVELFNLNTPDQLDDARAFCARHAGVFPTEEN